MISLINVAQKQQDDSWNFILKLKSEVLAAAVESVNVPAHAEGVMWALGSKLKCNRCVCDFTVTQGGNKNITGGSVMSSLSIVCVCSCQRLLSNGCSLLMCCHGNRRLIMRCSLSSREDDEDEDGEGENVCGAQNHRLISDLSALPVTSQSTGRRSIKMKLTLTDKIATWWENRCGRTCT